MKSCGYSLLLHLTCVVKLNLSPFLSFVFHFSRPAFCEISHTIITIKLGKIQISFAENHSILIQLMEACQTLYTWNYKITRKCNLHHFLLYFPSWELFTKMQVYMNWKHWSACSYFICILEKIFCYNKFQYNLLDFYQLDPKNDEHCTLL